MSWIKPIWVQIKAKLLGFLGTFKTLIYTGGGGGPPPLDISRDYSARREALAATLLWQFSFEFPAHFDTIFVTAGGTVPKFT